GRCAASNPESRGGENPRQALDSGFALCAPRNDEGLALAFCFDAFSSREPVPIPDQVRDRLSLKDALINRGLADRGAEIRFQEIEIAALIGLLDMAREHPAIAALVASLRLLPGRATLF